MRAISYGFESLQSDQKSVWVNLLFTKSLCGMPQSRQNAARASILGPCSFNWIEHWPSKPGVVGSNPTRGTTLSRGRYDTVQTWRCS